MKYLFLVLTAVTFCFSQDLSLYIPRNLEDAYYFNTRSYDGKPGKDYWINKSSYDINVEVQPDKRMVSGEEVITYYNNSPDELYSIVLRTYQDFYKKGNTRDWQVDPEAINDGVRIECVKVGKEIFTEGTSNGKYDRNGTNITIRLTEILPSMDSVEIKVKWSFEIPFKNSLRMGMYDESTFFISYWYPQVAVYDDIDGWDIFNYKGTTEMYNDFNDYDIKIKVPKDYIVWGTGLLQNPDEVLEGEFVDRLKTVRESDDIINIITSSDLKSGSITKQIEKNVWHFKADHVPDFAFALSKHYLWDCVSYKTPDNRNVQISSAYNPDSDDFYQVAEIARKTIKYLSEDFPGIPYPYPAMTIFNGHGGMEYPMMVNDGSEEFISSTIRLTSHEITHTYFPFYMGTNERKYAWMDEGWAVMIPFDFQTSEAKDADPRVRNMSSIKNRNGQETDIPPMIPSVFLTEGTYRVASYSRPALAYDYLRDMLGKEKFDNTLREFIKRWNGKHPIPYDFFFTFNEVLGENLNWYWKPWFFESGFADLAIDKVFTYEDRYEVFIKKVGNIPIPIKATIEYMDGSTSEICKTAEVWKEDNSDFILKLDKSKKVKSITLGGPHILDVDSINDYVIVE